MINTEIILYTTPKGDIKIEVFLQDETVWLTQRAMGELFGVVKSTNSEHLANISKAENWDKRQLFGKSEQFNMRQIEKSKTFQL